MKVSPPRFKVGDRVETACQNKGTVLGRSFDNLLHGKEWKYEIQWDDGTQTNHHYCFDLCPVKEELPA